MTPATAKERLAAFLVARDGSSFCDACAARALGIDPSTAYSCRGEDDAGPRFVREYALCSDCGASRLITRSAG